MPDITIDFQASAIFECGATLLSFLALPTDPQDRRADLHASICAAALRHQFDLGRETAARPYPMKPIHAFRERKQIDKDINILERRLGERMAAAQMGIGLLKPVCDPNALPPRGLQSFSLNQLSELASNSDNASESGNVETRIWRPSIPVIHLAIAVAILFDRLARHAQWNLATIELVQSETVIREIIQLAEVYEDLCAKIPSLEITKDRLIRFRLA